MYKSYQVYCPQENGWLDSLPVSWKTKKIKHIVSTKVTDGPHTTPEILFDGIPFVSAESVKNQRIDLDYKRGYISIEDHLEFCKKCKPQKEDIFMVKSGATTGNIAYVDIDEEFSIWSPLALIRSRKNEYSQKFVFYFMQSKYFRQQVEISWNYGTQQNIGMGIIENLHLFTPLYEEQIAIADFLDRKTENIKLQIAYAQKMIGLLEEKKEVIIINAVTKGLDQNALLKDSGIEWIGEIPEHWEVKKIKNLFFVYNGATPKSDNDAYWDGDIIWVTPADYATSDIYISDSKRKITYEGLTSCATKIVPENSIIVSNRAPIGAIALAGKPLCTNQGCKALVKKANAQIDEKYIYYYLSTQQDILNMLGKGTTFLELSSYDLSSFSMPFPQIEVQTSIANYLDKKISYINGIILKNQNLIKKLTEYQEALITAAVTGKIDVRGE